MGDNLISIVYKDSDTDSKEMVFIERITHREAKKRKRKRKEDERLMVEAKQYERYMNSMQYGLKLYYSPDGWSYRYVGKIECWYENSDPPMISLKYPSGKRWPKDREAITITRKWYYKKADPALKDYEIYACRGSYR